MKLDNKLKQKIDAYFANISAEELHQLLIQKYNFIEDDDNLVTCTGDYQCNNHTLSESYRNDLSYVIDYVDLNFECVPAKTIQEPSGSVKEDTTNLTNGSSIPFAA